MLICMIILLLHYLFSYSQPVRWPTKNYFLFAFFFTIISRQAGTFFLIFTLPLLPELHLHIERILSPSVKYFVSHPGIDIIAGYSIGLWSRLKFIERINMKKFWIALPWPLNLLLLFLAISALIGTIRNLWRSADSSDISILLSNLLSFKLIDRMQPYYPLVDWMTYGFCGIIIFSLQYSLRHCINKDDIIFRPILWGLACSAVFGIFQAFTCYGLPFATHGYRLEVFGCGAQAGQPDLHAFAAHMLIGSVGLLGYFLKKTSTDNHIHKTSIFVWILSWTALILSKSRASVLFSIIFNLGFIYIYFFKIYFNRLLISILLISGLMAVGFFLYVTNNLYWILDIVNNIISLDLGDRAALNKLSNHRFDLHGTALVMGWNFPWFGVGQGLFYPLSNLKSFVNFDYFGIDPDNAHNYFFQTFAETGLVGIFCFTLIFLYPIRECSNRHHLLPVLVAIISIFLGNIYSHSLLTRENLYLLASFVALLYGNITLTHTSYARRKIRDFYIIDNILLAFQVSLVFLIIYLAADEIWNSFEVNPFIYESAISKQK